MTRATGRVTLTAVARSAGVSAITASRALRGDRNVAAELVARVVAASEALNYIPDPAAQSLASSRSRNIVVLIPSLTNRVFGELLDAVQASLASAGYQTLLGVTHYDPIEEERLIRSYLAFRPAGLILSSSDHTDAAKKLMSDSTTPQIHIMETGAAGSGFFVGFSQFDAAYELTRHMVDSGRRKIAFVGAQLDPRVMQRMEGYRQCLLDSGLYDPALEILDPQPSSIALGYSMLDRLLKLRPEIDAVFFCNDDLAQGTLFAALQSGLNVPGQLAVAGFNDLEGSDFIPPGLTTVRTPRAEIGRETAKLLLQILENGELPAKTVNVGFDLVLRGSTVAPR